MTRRLEDLGDEELLARYVGDPRGDGQQAFSVLVDRHHLRVYRVCYRYFGDATDAEDATQETFLALARKASTFSADAQLSTWLYRVAVNACHDIARRRARRPQTPVAELPERGSSLDESAGVDTAIDLRRALTQLDETSRALLILISIEGLSYEEASTAVDMPVGTVKSRVHRARARLADLLEGVAP